MRVLVTGARGFIGKNLLIRLQELKEFEVVRFGHDDDFGMLQQLVKEVDWIIHLAGVNRPENTDEFTQGNTDFTEAICQAVKACGRAIPMLYSSSIQASGSGDYGMSKLAAEELLQVHSKSTGSPVYIYRLPNVFGKWARPSYNSVVATFCYNVARGLPIKINDPDAMVNLVYIDDVVDSFLNLLKASIPSSLYMDVQPTYKVTIGELADQLYKFDDLKSVISVDKVGAGFLRALYATYVSYLPKESFSYEVEKHSDPRGTFVEMLKTVDSGQLSYFTALPGVTRGGHYHHTKTEKFLVIKGAACFRFRNLITNEYFEITTTGERPEIVETVPGWTHDVTNIGQDELICMLWANEVFDVQKPDTIGHPLD